MDILLKEIALGFYDSEYHNRKGSLENIINKKIRLRVLITHYEEKLSKYKIEDDEIVKF